MTTVDEELAREFAATAHDILGRLSTTPEVRAQQEAGGFSADAWQRAVEAGWFEALVDEAADGLGLSLNEVGPIFTAAGRHLFAGPLAEQMIVGARALSAAGEPAQVRLRLCASGAAMLAVADPAAFGADARPTITAGRLTGACATVRFGTEADELFVVADGPGGTALVLVEAARAGVGVAPRPCLDPATRLAAVEFDGVRIDADDEIAVGSDADALLDRLHGELRVGIACELSGIADHAVDLAVAYAKEREQFGRPIGAFQSLQHILAEMARENFGLAQVCQQVARVQPDPATVRNSSMVAKAHAATSARSITEGSLQVHGGIAFTIEHELHRYYKHVLFLQGLYGDPAVLYHRLGQDLVTGSRSPWPAWF